MPSSIFDSAHTSLVELLIAARKGLRLTQAQLGARLGRSQSFISLIERGQRRVDVIEFVALARALEVEPEAMFAELLTQPKA
ncbi:MULTISPECIES: helix-turn-helix domain-containing protein [unclassified Caulobacter]|jgi:transcriptional regulator with XRE-family HTH domain|uniref:helix-turn-helix domain-containing protein n=1 Tax=unclassified Caulobacter TaxID=2648921 RepID=UPI00078377F9|nr:MULTISPECIES: helix-turn-helix transcriptional regulator [unclassified Caulobacter]AZS23312.1 XRE family transcriptional regulator [Caulobacter sp. FWC26]